MKIIYNMRLAGFLMERGFVLVDMMPDKRSKKRNVFYFRNTPELTAAMHDFCVQKRN